MNFSLIAAITSNNGIAKDGKIPWHNSDELGFFYKTTKNSVCIMGRKTWESLPGILVNRVNVVITSRKLDLPNVILVSSFNEAIARFCNGPRPVFVIGGEKLYADAIHHPKCSRLYLSHVKYSGECDQFFPDYDKKWFPTKKLAETDFFTARVYEIHPEYQYLNLVRETLISGQLVNFSKSLRFNLEAGFPLLTTKKMHWRGVVEELLWFLSGSVNSADLQKKGINIWNANSTREYLDSRGLDYPEGILGPVYGFQWRKWGSTETFPGFDQIRKCVSEIRTNPNSRRILVNAWNVADLDKMALPPCHVLFQFNVDGDKLICDMYQRSADIGLGLPFNIASYALLTHLVAHVCGKTPAILTIHIGNAHVYKQHVEALQIQVGRFPNKFPEIKINPAKKEIDEITAEDIQLFDYKHSEMLYMKLVT